MLTEKEYRLLEKEINKLFKAMVIDVRKDIFRRIETAGEMTETAKYQLQSMANIGQLNQDIMNTIIKHNTINEKDIFGIINKYSIKDLKNDNELFLKKGVDKDKLKITDDMREVIRATFKRANNDIKNLTMTTAIGEIDGFLEEVNRLYLETQIGAKTQEQAIRDMKRRYQDKVPYVKYPSGAKRKLPYAMKVILSTSVNQTASELQMKRAEVLETRLMEITAHPDSRPSHTEWQGKIVDLDGKNKKYLTLDDIGYGRGDGFLGFGCRHNWHPYIEGETPVYDKGELKELKEKSIKLAEEKKKEKSDLEEYKRLIKHREHITDLPKNYEKFKELKYNNKTEYDKIKEEQYDIRIRKLLGTDKYPLTVHEGKQGKHIKNHNNYIEGRSIVNISIPEIQELINKYHGTGKLKRDGNKKWREKEFITTDKNIGMYISKDGEIREESKKFTIIYSKNGTHIVPRNPKED